MYLSFIVHGEEVILASMFHEGLSILPAVASLVTKPEEEYITSYV